MLTKYNFEIEDRIVEMDINRLTNQIWKLIPMNENKENWQSQLTSVLNELVGLNSILKFNNKYLILLSKLEGLTLMEYEFVDFRRIVFESISLLREVGRNVNSTN